MRSSKLSRKRRDFIKTISLAVGATAISPRTKSWPQITGRSELNLSGLRKKTAYKRRRIIMNNDGNDFSNATPEEPKTPENFLSKRTSPLIGSHVDAIFYCTGVFNYYTHRSKETELLSGENTAAKYVHELINHGTDSLEVMTDFCKNNNMECFWSMRMNDNHDSYTQTLLPKWKKDHPELLMGNEGDQFLFVRRSWSMVDYTHEEVREKVFSILKDVASRYDINGLEYDFFRHPALFKSQLVGDQVTDSHRKSMTDLLKRVRGMTEKIAKERGKPFLIACRIPDSVGFCRAIGLDIELWLSEDLIDIVTGGGYFKLEPWESLVSLGKKYNVPVYACLVARRIMGGGEPEAESALKVWRGEALNAWKASIDGIYTFNRFNPIDPIFRELGDPEILESLERIERTSYTGDTGYFDPGWWVKNGRDYIRKD